MADHRADETTGGNALERLWDTEPVRTALYAVIVLVVGMLVARGVIVESLVPVILAGVAGALGVAGTEVARSIAYSPATVQAVRLEAYATGVRAALHATPDSAAAGNRRCREVRDGVRCPLPLGHEGGHIALT